ncbi:MAG: hypothetical protein VYE73_04585 [Acidobacteriota bacterium]|nr:hypothetical protein [Acidobacteriota bacterium]
MSDRQVAIKVLPQEVAQDLERPLVASQTHREFNADISPDGRWLAYQSDEAGRDEAYVRPFPDVDSSKWASSTDGGREPVWSRGGSSELYYRGDSHVMAVSIATTPGFEAGPPE